MRSDMPHVLTGGTNHPADVLIKRALRRHFNDPAKFEEAATHGSMSRRRQYGYQSNKQRGSGVRWALIRAFLAANVGRLWNDVYADLRRHFRKANHHDLIDYFLWRVDRNVLIKNGLPYQRVSFSFANEVLVTYDRFYVHPESGLLLRGVKDRARYTKPNPAPTFRQVFNKVSRCGECRIIDGEVYIKVKGIWYLADMRPVPAGIAWGKPHKTTRKDSVVNWNTNPPTFSTMDMEWLDRGPFDIIFGRAVGWCPLPSRFDKGDKSKYVQQIVQNFYGRLDRYCANNGRQLDTKTLARLGLKND